MPTPRQRTCGLERPRGPVTNFLALSPRAIGKCFGSAHCAARHARPHARALASAHTDGRRTNDATCGPQAWLTGSLHEGGDTTERMLTAAAGPSPRDPYRHALAMRPPRKVRPFSFLNYYCVDRSRPAHCTQQRFRRHVGVRPSTKKPEVCSVPCSTLVCD